ncbi:putative LPS assembly protein LptD [Rubrivirga sp.]|uniref:putative LPS assembly protein LptD n=1 Tax=Rubrivirga sp. TaxID=1885344 RepID=UPI003B52C37B
MPRLVLAVLALGLAVSARAQDAPPDSARADSVASPPPVALDALAARPDTADAAPISLPVPRAAPAEGGLDRAVRYTATDSLRVTLAPRGAPADDGPGDVVSLFGNVQTEYEGAQISAGRVDYETARELLRASGVPTDSGATGVPQYQGEEGQFSGREVVYNLRTGRGRVTGARTQIEDGYLLGGILKQQDAHVVFAQSAAYTTCELDHPHYAVEAGRMKIVDGERVYTGPVRLKLLGIPMPLVLPFGYFPAAEGRRSGPLPFRYGRDSVYGLYLDDVGWYWALSEYLDAQVSGRVGTQASFQLDGQLRYNRRYAYSGNVAVQVGRIRSGEPTDPDFAPRTPLGLRWSHNQTFPAGQRLTASVNLQSVSQRLVSDNVSDQIQASTTSSVQYNQQWPSVGRSLSLSAQAFQDFAGNRTTATLPQLAFSQQRLFPFRRGRDDRWYEKISLSYTANAQNAFAFQPISDSTGISALDALFRPSAFRQATCAEDAPDCDPRRFDYLVTQSVPISAAFSVPRFNLTFGPNLSYTETWTDETLVQTYDPVLKRAVPTREPGFTPFRRFVASASVATELFGTFPIRIGALDGIRHTITPQASLSFEPDYARLGFVDEVQVDSTGRTRRYAINPSIPTDPTRSLSFSVQNAFVGRTVRTDSTGEETRQTRQLLSLSLTGGYNFAAEREPFRPVSARFTTTAFGVNASGGASFSAYAVDTLVTASPVTYFETTGRPLRLTNASLQVSRSFQSGRRADASDVRPVRGAPVLGDPYDPGSVVPRSATVGYLDYAAPWSVALGLTLSRTAATASGDGRTLATLGVQQFNARLTPNWSLTGSSGVDLTSLEITTTRLGLRRDLHCWEMSVDWQPIGITKSFSVSLYVKSGFLRDFLRLDVPNSTVRTGGFGQRF